MPGLEFKMMFL